MMTFHIRRHLHLLKSPRVLLDGSHLTRVKIS